jgi:ribosomal protein S12 methylthiotransferase accessory factor
LPKWLGQLDGRTILDLALNGVPPEQRTAAQEIVDRLYGERVLVDGAAADAHMPVHYEVVPAGKAAWAANWAARSHLSEAVAGHGEFSTAVQPLPVLCQDRLDYDEALCFNRRCLANGSRWLWASTGPMTRAYVSPLFFPGAGPCLSCLLYHFRRLSPAPELYAALVDHGRTGKPVIPVPAPAPAIAIVQQLVLWKAGLAAQAEPPAALFRLHVLELTSLEVSSHRVFVDPECPECGGRN